MKIRISSRWSSNSPPPFGATPARAIRDAQTEQRRVVGRLQALIESHQESAIRMNVALEVEDVLTVIDALEAEAKRSDPLPLLNCPDEVRQYARFVLYDEMLGEPSNVFIATPVDAETTRYEAMPRSFWLDCLRALRREWQAEPPATSTEDIATPPEIEGRKRARNPSR